MFRFLFTYCFTVSFSFKRFEKFQNCLSLKTKQFKTSVGGKIITTSAKSTFQKTTDPSLNHEIQNRFLSKEVAKCIFESS